MSIIFLLMFIFSSQKEIKKDIRLSYDKLYDLYPAYDYQFYTSSSHYVHKKLYCLAETKLKVMPFDICYSFSNDTSKRNISIYFPTQLQRILLSFNMILSSIYFLNFSIVY